MSELIQFDDLTNYSHQIAPFTLAGVKNVGWLDIESAFPRGGVPPATLQKLRSIVGGLDGFQPLVEPIRESPTCQICGALNLADATGKLLPSAELWIPAGETIYAAPIAILHYIEVHNYRPPTEYIEAIDALKIGTSFTADEVYRAKLMESGWFNRVR
ncbi:hypothetical protein [Massilia sp. 9096]|uniref:DUF7919 family protein n=1 Tax=Massilia sp. 9096 TaxID=1500894 RepID=UPI0012E0B75B|nr:hypothetical protein [Massilia sp. 9096]